MFSKKKVFRALGAGELVPRDVELPIVAFNSAKDINSSLAIGSDSDIGGKSTASLTWDEPSQSAHFSGNLSLEIPSDSKLERTGYAGFRTVRPRWSMFAKSYIDADLHSYLALRIKADRRKYFVNIQADEVNPANIWQHRLYSRTPGQWETVVISFDDFVITNAGRILGEQAHHFELEKMKIQTIGISLLERNEGPFSLHVKWIKGLNDEHLAKNGFKWASSSDRSRVALEEEGEEEEDEDEIESLGLLNEKGIGISTGAGAVENEEVAWEQKIAQRLAEQREREKRERA